MRSPPEYYIQMLPLIVMQFFQLFCLDSPKLKASECFVKKLTQKCYVGEGNSKLRTFYEV